MAEVGFSRGRVSPGKSFIPLAKVSNLGESPIPTASFLSKQCHFHFRSAKILGRFTTLFRFPYTRTLPSPFSPRPSLAPLYIPRVFRGFVMAPCNFVKGGFISHHSCCNFLHDGSQFSSQLFSQRPSRFPRQNVFFKVALVLVLLTEAFCRTLAQIPT